MNYPCRSQGNPSLLSMQPCLLSASSTSSADIKRLCWLILRPAPGTLAHAYTQTLGVVFQHRVQIRYVEKYYAVEVNSKGKDKSQEENLNRGGLLVTFLPVCPCLFPCFK